MSTYVFIVLWKISKIGNGGSYGKSIFINKLPNCFLKWLYYVFPYHYITYNYSTSLPLLGIVTFLDFNHSRGCELYPVTVFICISLMTNDEEHLYMYFYAVHIYFLRKCLLKLKSSYHFLTLWYKLFIDIILQVFSPNLWFAFLVS